jgi:hypothetical protein
LQDVVMLGTIQKVILEQYLGNRPFRIKYWHGSWPLMMPWLNYYVLNLELLLLKMNLHSNQVDIKSFNIKLNLQLLLMMMNIQQKEM